MPETTNLDLSKLKIDRESGTEAHPRSSRVIRKIFLLGLGVSILIPLLIFFQKNLGTAEEVEVTTASLGYPSQTNAVLTASGYVVAQQKAAIASKATGRLMYLGFEEGDRVRKGQIIGRIESADVEAALDQAKANLEQNKAEKNDTEQTLMRARRLFERQLIAQAELDAAQARYDRVAASIASAKAAVKAAEVQLENTLIRAPFDGTILTKNADVGEVVAPFGAGASSRVAVVTLADMSSLQVEADVSESNIQRITTGQACEIVLDAYPDKRYRGFVHKIVPTADRAKATVLTKVRFVDKDDRVLPEMSAKVYFLAKPHDNTMESTPKLLIDASAIANRNGRAVVFLLKDGAVSEVPVDLGQSLGKNVEVVHGLSANDKAVLRPSDNLKSGSSVRIKP